MSTDNNDNTSAAARPSVELLAEQLRASGVDHYYGIVGVPITPLAEALQQQTDNHTNTFYGFRNEQSASYAASVAGYLTGRPACCMTVSGPGVLHALPGVANAAANCWPMLLLSSRPSEPFTTSLGAHFQALPQSHCLEPYVRYSATVETVESFADHLHAALKAAMEGPGPVYLELPAYLFSSTTNIVSSSTTTPMLPSLLLPPAHPEFSDETVNHVLELLKDAKSPLVIGGKGAAYARAEYELRHLCSAANLPFLSSPMGKGLLPDSDERNVSSARSLALKSADVVLVFGARLNWLFGHGKSPPFAPNRTLVHVDMCEANLIGEDKDAVQQTNVRVHAGCREFAQALATLCEEEKWSFSNDEWWTTLRTNMASNSEKLAKSVADDTLPFGYHYVMAAIRRAAPPDTLFVNEGANTMDYGRLLLSNNDARQRLDAGVLATMGIGMGYVIAAATTRSEEYGACHGKVVAVLGDSAFGFSAMEFEVLVRYALKDVVVIVINNSGVYRGVEELDHSKPLPTTALTPYTGYEKLAEACGARGYLVRDHTDLQKALEEAMTSEQPSLINIIIRTNTPLPKIVAQEH